MTVLDDRAAGRPKRIVVRFAAEMLHDVAIFDIIGDAGFHVIGSKESPDRVPGMEEIVLVLEATPPLRAFSAPPLIDLTAVNDMDEVKLLFTEERYGRQRMVKLSSVVVLANEPVAEPKV